MKRKLCPYALAVRPWHVAVGVYQSGEPEINLLDKAEVKYYLRHFTLPPGSLPTMSKAGYKNLLLF